MDQDRARTSEAAAPGEAERERWLVDLYERAKGSARTGTTKRGISPVFADKVSYNGIRLADLADETRFAEKLRVQLSIKNPIFVAFGMDALDFEQVYQEKRQQYHRDNKRWGRL